MRMAEFGVTASAVGVASLAVQIGQSIRQAVEFWDSVQEAPDEIHRFSTDLRNLANILSILEHEARRSKIPEWQEKIVQESLMNVKRGIDRLASLVSDLERRVGGTNSRSRRCWGRIKIALKERELSKHRDCINSSRDALVLLQTCLHQSAMAEFNGKLDVIATVFQPTLFASPPPQSPNQIHHEMENLHGVTTYSTSKSKALVQLDKNGRPDYPRMNTKVSWKAYNAGIGTLTFRSTTTRFMQKQQDFERFKEDNTLHKSFAISLVLRFGSCRRGFDLRINDTFDIWSLNSIRRVPDDSPVFQLCINGDTKSVKQLVLCGMASPFDVDSSSRSLLHYACASAHPSLCRYLICELNADVYMTDDENTIPVLTLKGYKCRVFPHTSSVEQTLDVLMRHGDFDTTGSLDLSCRAIENQGFDLDCGLPFQNLKYALQEDSYFSDVRSRIIFIGSNMMRIRSSDALGSIEYLCTEYELVRRRCPDDPTWMDIYPFLWLCILSLLHYHESKNDKKANLMAQKASLILKLSNDLHRTWADGHTAFDIFLKDYPSAAPLWLRFLAENNVNLHDYCRREQDLHPDGYIKPAVSCCTLFTLSVIYGASKYDVTINVAAQKDPRFDHLDPRYLCKGLSIGRNTYLAELDDTIIGNDGRPCCGIPGAWEDRIKPNSALIWRRHWAGNIWGFNSISEIPKEGYEIVDYDVVQNAVLEKVSVNSLEAIEQFSQFWRLPMSHLDDSPKN